MSTNPSRAPSPSIIDRAEAAAAMREHPNRATDVNRQETLSKVTASVRRTEHRNVMRRYANLGAIKKSQHKVAHPGHKFNPPRTISKASRKGDKRATQETHAQTCLANHGNSSSILQSTQQSIQAPSQSTVSPSSSHSTSPHIPSTTELLSQTEPHCHTKSVPHSPKGGNEESPNNSSGRFPRPGSNFTTDSSKTSSRTRIFFTAIPHAAWIVMSRNLSPMYEAEHACSPGHRYVRFRSHEERQNAMDAAAMAVITRSPRSLASYPLYAHQDAGSTETQDLAIFWPMVPAPIERVCGYVIQADDGVDTELPPAAMSLSDNSESEFVPLSEEDHFNYEWLG